MQSAPANQPIYKKIDNYVFNFDELLGQGNFSKVYRGRHELTSTVQSTQMRRSPSKSSNSIRSNRRNSKNCCSPKSTC